MQKISGNHPSHVAHNHLSYTTAIAASHQPSINRPSIVDIKVVLVLTSNQLSTTCLLYWFLSSTISCSTITRPSNQQPASSPTTFTQHPGRVTSISLQQQTTPSISCYQGAGQPSFYLRQSQGVLQHGQQRHLPSPPPTTQLPYTQSYRPQPPPFVHQPQDGMIPLS